MRLEELRDVLGGSLAEDGDRRWLETRVGEHRAFVIERRRHPAGTVLEIAVSTPTADDPDPFSIGDDPLPWYVENELTLPRLEHGFVFAGCQHGMLLATSTSERTLEQIVSSLWELAAWARKSWEPAFRARGYVTRPGQRRPRRRHRIRSRLRRERTARLAIVALVVLVVLLLRALVIE